MTQWRRGAFRCPFTQYVGHGCFWFITCTHMPNKSLLGKPVEHICGDQSESCSMWLMVVRETVAERRVQLCWTELQSEVKQGNLVHWEGSLIVFLCSFNVKMPPSPNENGTTERSRLISLAHAPCSFFRPGCFNGFSHWLLFFFYIIPMEHNWFSFFFYRQFKKAMYGKGLRRTSATSDKKKNWAV